MAVEPETITSEQWNGKVNDWTSNVGTKIRGAIQASDRKGKGKLLSSFREKTYKRGEEIDRISFIFERHGVFWHKGVGRGYIMVAGGVVRGMRPKKQVVEYGKKKNRKVGPVLLSGGINRHPVGWFNPIIRSNIAGLADIVAEISADQAINESKILIK